MTREQFEDIAQLAYDNLPGIFKEKIDNVRIIVEDYPTEKELRSVGLKSKHHLLGLYQGIPALQRGSWYGMTPMLPDTIFLFQNNIQGVCKKEEEIPNKIREVLIHEIAHYFGMNEEEVRAAGF
ncbi:MAG: metallopeptidase family protein [Ignavibacteriales bacterium]|nr:metallopeptidase family protein [Ignavibacteriales bacterium]